jgi:hypothetical protein
MAKFILYPALAICLLASCKKSEEKKLIGDWLQTEWADDNNGNKLMDANEVHKSTTGGMYNTVYTFKNDDELQVLWGDVMENGTWKLQNEGKELVTTLHGLVTKYKIVTQEDNTLLLEMKGNGGMLFWQTLTKQ